MFSKLAAFKSSIKALKHNTKLLESELVNAELNIDNDEDVDENEDIVELSNEEKAAVLIDLRERCVKLSDALVATEQLSKEDADELTANILESNTNCEDIPDNFALVEEFLPKNALNISVEHFCDEDDHAMLVELFVDSTNGKWVANNFTSTYEDDYDRWFVNFEESGDTKSWRFSQYADQLNLSFLDQLVQYTQHKSGQVVSIVDSFDDSVQIVSLPAQAYNVLFESPEQQIAA